MKIPETSPPDIITAGQAVREAPRAPSDGEGPMLRSTCTRRTGLVVPHLACAACGRPVERADAGLVQVFRDGRIRIVHRNFGGFACDDRPNGATWVPLGTFIHALLRGIRFDAKAARLEAKRWAGMM